MSQQLGFDLPSVPALGRADFLVAPSNAVALAMIECWQGWTAGKLMLCGPAGAGKTHLAHVWANAAGGRIIDATTLLPREIPALARQPLAIEDIPLASGNPTFETALFHLHNLCQTEGQPLLLTGRGRPADWGITLPDLESRVTSAPVAQLNRPDDALLAAVLAKLFADRQLAPAPDLIEYLLRRMDRSFAAARETVVLLDSASLAAQRPITRSFAGRVLDKNL